MTYVIVDTLAAATAWRKRNPHAYHALVEWATEDAANGSRCSIALYVELLRRPHFAKKLGLRRSSAQVLIDNDLRADLARLIMREHKELRGCFRTRSSKADNRPLRGLQRVAVRGEPSDTLTPLSEPE